MNQEETKVAGQLLAIKQLLALLVARESVHSGVKVDLLHEPLIQEIADALAPFASHERAAPLAGELEAAATKCLDDVFSWAARMRLSMPSPEDDSGR